jgi:glycosyltransferase involved in cell wall biosynthesis
MITVVIPTHNRAAWLNVALLSVLQSPLVAPDRVIVVADACHDDTEAVAHHHGVRYLQVCYCNISQTRNAGLALCRTDFVTFLDDDDCWIKGNMEAHYAALELHPHAAFAFGIARCATEQLQPLEWRFPTPPLATTADELHLGYPQLGTVLFRRRAVVDIGGFNKCIKYHQDADLLLRLAARHEIVGVNVIGVMFRLRPFDKQSSDYFWERRDTTWWSPPQVRWTTRALFRWRTKALFCARFLMIADACVQRGQRRKALESLVRAVRVSPIHALRYPRTLVRILLHRHERGAGVMLPH